ncbi:alpha/beta hydrolase-fold protein, partial [Achromobacter sp.]
AQAARATLPGTAQFDLQAPGRPDQPYRIQVAEPRGKPPANGLHPVIYLLDGNAVFGAYYDATRLQQDLAGSAIVVAVGYPTDLPFDFLRRSYDFSPPEPPGKPLPRVNGYPPPLGGEQALLAFLEHTLLPEIARRYPVDPRRRILVGHSFGGMYALNVLYTRPDLFTQIVSISPSLWWQDHYLLERESAFMRQTQAGKHDLRRSRLLLMAGGAESPQTVHEARSLARRLDQSLAPQGLATVYVELPEETHMSVPVAAATHVLRHVLTARQQ